MLIRIRMTMDIPINAPPKMITQANEEICLVINHDMISNSIAAKGITTANCLHPVKHIFRSESLLDFLSNESLSKNQ